MNYQSNYLISDTESEIDNIFNKKYLKNSENNMVGSGSNWVESENFDSIVRTIKDALSNKKATSDIKTIKKGKNFGSLSTSTETHVLNLKNHEDIPKIIFIEKTINIPNSQSGKLIYNNDDFESKLKSLFVHILRSILDIDIEKEKTDEIVTIAKKTDKKKKTEVVTLDLSFIKEYFKIKISNSLIDKNYTSLKGKFDLEYIYEELKVKDLDKTVENIGMEIDRKLPLLTSRVVNVKTDNIGSFEDCIKNLFSKDKKKPIYTQNTNNGGNVEYNVTFKGDNIPLPKITTKNLTPQFMLTIRTDSINNPQERISDIINKLIGINGNVFSDAHIKIESYLFGDNVNKIEINEEPLFNKIKTISNKYFKEIFKDLFIEGEQTQITDIDYYNLFVVSNKIGTLDEIIENIKTDLDSLKVALEGNENVKIEQVARLIQNHPNYFTLDKLITKTKAMEKHIKENNCADFDQILRLYVIEEDLDTIESSHCKDAKFIEKRVETLSELSKTSKDQQATDKNHAMFDKIKSFLEMQTTPNDLKNIIANFDNLKVANQVNDFGFYFKKGELNRMHQENNNFQKLKDLTSIQDERFLRPAKENWTAALLDLDRKEDKTSPDDNVTFENFNEYIKEIHKNSEGLLDVAVLGTNIDGFDEKIYENKNFSFLKFYQYLICYYISGGQEIKILLSEVDSYKEIITVHSDKFEYFDTVDQKKVSQLFSTNINEFKHFLDNVQYVQLNQTVIDMVAYLKKYTSLEKAKQEYTSALTKVEEARPEWDRIIEVLREKETSKKTLDEEEGEAWKLIKPYIKDKDMNGIENLINGLIAIKNISEDGFSEYKDAVTAADKVIKAAEQAAAKTLASATKPEGGADGAPVAAKEDNDAASTNRKYRKLPSILTLGLKNFL